MGERFHYLKREFKLLSNRCDIRCDYKQYESVAEDVDVFKKFYRKTLLEQNVKKNTAEELQGADVAKFRSVVGRLVHMSGERPDAQFAIQSLARHMARPTQQAWKTARHVCSYLQGTEGFGARLRAKGQFVMDLREAEEVEDKQKHLLEIVTDADYAGNKDDRKSAKSFQVFLDGNLMESRVRGQKSVSLSSTESEFVAMVGGCSDGLLVRHLWMQLVKEEIDLGARSDNSAARAMVQRQGIGRVRHLDASLLWIQQKEKDKILSVNPIRAELRRHRDKVMDEEKIVRLAVHAEDGHSIGDRVGEEEYQELEHREKMKRGLKKVIKKKKEIHVGLLLLEGDEWHWSAFCLLALSVIHWLRHFMLKNMLEKIWVFIKEAFKVAKNRQKRPSAATK